MLPAKATADAVAAGLALYKGILQLGKSVTIAAAAVPEMDMMGVDKIATDIQTGGDSLVVSFPYTDGSIDKVDYQIQGDRFNLVIVPREGNPKLEPNDVQFTYSGGKIDYIIAIDCPNLNALGELYTKNQRQFDGKTIINIDRHLVNANYGLVNVVQKTSASTSELVMQVMKGLKVKIDKDTATNLYAGLMGATNNLTAYSVNAETFETVAELLRAGAVKKPMPMGGMNNPNPMGGGFGGRSFPPFGGSPMGQMGGYDGGFGGAGMNPQMQSAPFPQGQLRPSGGFQQAPTMPNRPFPQQGQKFNERPQIKKIQQVEKETRPQDAFQAETAPEDELKPRIFSEEEDMM